MTLITIATVEIYAVAIQAGYATAAFYTKPDVPFIFYRNGGIA